MEYHPEWEDPTLADLELRFQQMLLAAEVQRWRLQYNVATYMFVNELVWGWKEPTAIHQAAYDEIIMRVCRDVPGGTQWLIANSPRVEQIITFLQLSPEDQQSIIGMARFVEAMASLQISPGEPVVIK